MSDQIVEKAGRVTAANPYRRVWIVLALLIPLAVLTFWQSYFHGRTFSGLTLSTLVHAHAAMMMLWLVMLVGQAWLIRAERYEVHKMVGRVSFVVAPLMALMTALLVHEVMNRKPEITQLDARIEIYDLMPMAAFLLVWGLAILYRKQTRLHMRFMISTAFALANAIVFRIILSWFGWVPGLSMAADPGNIDHVAAVNGGVLVLLLAGLIANDWRLGLRRSPYWVMMVVTVLIHIGFFTFTKSGWWMSGVLWYRGLW